MRIARAQYDAGMMRPLPREAFLQEDTYAKTRLPVDFAWTLIPDAYTSPDFHEVEREQVFAKSWIPVCVADEVAEPGDFLVRQVVHLLVRGDLELGADLLRGRAADPVDVREADLDPLGCDRQGGRGRLPAERPDFG